LYKTFSKNKDSAISLLSYAIEEKHCTL